MTKISRPTCSTCIYWDHHAGLKGVCRHTSSVLKERDKYEWCGDHPDFLDYERILNGSRPHCDSCVHCTPTEKSKEYEELTGHCSLKGGESMWAPYDSCYAHEGKK